MGAEVQSTNHTSSNEDEGELDKDSQTQERGHNTGRGRGRGQGRGYNKRNFRQNKNSHASTVKRNDDEEVGFIFKVSGIETFTHQTSWTKLSNINAPDSTVPDSSVVAPAPHIFSVEANQFNNYALFNSSVDFPSPRKYAPSTDIVESNVYDNKSNYGEFEKGVSELWGSYFARHQI